MCAVPNMNENLSKELCCKLSGVSVIIPAYNVESCLSRAVLSALNQDPPPLEVIVSNDGSTDKTAEVAQSFGDRIRYLEQANLGPAAARNSGLAVAKGEYVAFLDADDYWLPGFIRATTEFMEVNPEAVAVSTGWQIQPLKGAAISFPPLGRQPDIPCKPCMLENFFDFWARYDHIRTGTALIRSSKLGTDGIQRTDLRICEDLEFWAFLATKGPWGFIPEACWFGDSAREAARGGWIKKYFARRKFCPTVQMWQVRVLPNIKEDVLPSFKRIRGKVAASYVHNMVLAGRHQEARETFEAYAKEMPMTWITRLMFAGYRLGSFGWASSCGFLRLREYQKALVLAVGQKLSTVKR